MLTRQARKAATPSDDDLEAEMQQYAAPSTLVDPMIDVQGSDSDGDEEDDDDDDDDHDHDVPEVPAPTTAESSAGPSRRNLYKAPTLAELDELRAAEASGGNAFSLQLDELLKSTLLPTTPAPALKTLLGAVHDLVHGLPSLPAVASRSGRLGLRPPPRSLSQAPGACAAGTARPRARRATSTL
jgi:U3 small nucleolar RNA-associated protein 22